MGTLLALLFILLAVTDGFLLTFLVVAQASFFARLCYGSIVGMLALAWLSLLVSLLTGLNSVALMLTAVLLLAGLMLLYRQFAPEAKTALRGFMPDGTSLIYYLAWAGFLGWIFSRVVTFTDQGMQTAPANNYGDLPFHFSVITSFAFGENLPPRNPIFAGLPFTYPFLIDFLTAFCKRAGADWPAAFFLENIILALSLVGSIELLTMKLIGNRVAARIAPVLFLFNGGFGFVWFLSDLGKSLSDIFSFLAHLPRTYTMSDELHLRWGNLFTTLLIPQRSLLLGLPLAAMIIALWWKAVEQRAGVSGGMGEASKQEKGAKETRSGEGATRRGGDDVTDNQTESHSPALPIPLSPRLLFRHLGASQSRRFLLAAGILAGLMPMAHAHGFFSIMLVSGLLALLFFSWDWLYFFIPTGLLALPQALWLRQTPTRSKLFEWHPGWEAHDLWQAGQMIPLTFWLRNAGAFLVLLILALLIRKLLAARVREFYLPFLICFVLPNLVLLAPWAWDNIKVLLYWYLASCPLVAALLARLLSARLITARLTAVLLFITLTLSGAVDVLRALSPVENVVLFGKGELAAAEQIRANTPPHALLLNAPIHNSVVALTGRQALMGYPGHLWTHGIDYKEREADVLAMYRGDELSAELLKLHQVNYVVIGPVERSQFQANEAFFAERFRTVVDVAGYRVYEIRPRS